MSNMERVDHDEVSGGARAVAAAAAHGVETMFTLSGAHVFPLYDGAVSANPPMRLLDVRHEQTAVFAAEATGKLTRTPGLAVLTAGLGVTNGISAITQAHFSGSPLVVLGGRAATYSWGRGALQELDHPSLLGPVTKRAATIGSVDTIARLLAAAERPLVVLGTDVWSDRAEAAALRFVTDLGLPTITNGLGRGIVPGGHELLVARARRTAVGECDLALVVGAPLDFRLGYGAFGGHGGAPCLLYTSDAADE